MNIGVKPTFGSTLTKTIEVHLLDFYDDIYGDLIECKILFKVREECRFSSIEFLKKQIKEDIHYSNQKFKTHELFVKIPKNHPQKSPLTSNPLYYSRRPDV